MGNEIKAREPIAWPKNKTIAMPRKLLKRWINALESGEYKQGQHYLVVATPGEPDAFCCLGVLCDVGGANRDFREQAMPGQHHLDQMQVYFRNGDEKTQEGVLSTNDPAIGIDKAGDNKTAADYNDEGVKFKKIARMIKRSAIALEDL
jgi:hypothetical protein